MHVLDALSSEKMSPRYPHDGFLPDIQMFKQSLCSNITLSETFHDHPANDIIFHSHHALRP